MEANRLHDGGYFGEDETDCGPDRSHQSWQMRRLARYVGKYARLRGNYNYLWDELAAAAWLDPSLITKKETLFMDVDMDRGASYGNTLSWTNRDKPKIELQPVEVQDDVDLERFYKLFVNLLTAPTPRKN